MQSIEDLNRKFTAVIRKLASHDRYFKVVFDELKKLTTSQPLRAGKLASPQRANRKVVLFQPGIVH